MDSCDFWILVDWVLVGLGVVALVGLGISGFCLGFRVLVAFGGLVLDFCSVLIYVVSCCVYSFAGFGWLVS